MDPNLFHVDTERVFEALLAVTVLAFMLERALAIVFEQRVFVEHLGNRGLKELITFGAALYLCIHWDFDAVSAVILAPTTQKMGHVITAGIIAGGSKASVKLFHDVFNIMSSAERKRQGKSAKADDKKDGK